MGKKLHATVVFRSHDTYAAYPQNLAAVCLYLCRMAEKHGMEVGTVTCLSVSAHLYSRDWAAARAVVELHKPPAMQWDMRSSWLVEAAVGGCTIFAGQPCSCYAREGACRHNKVKAIRATATDPSSHEVIAVVEARNPENLRREILATGLVTSMGAALWLGDEIRRVWLAASR